MAEFPAPLAPRLKRPSWRDPRLVFGVLIVLGSLLLGTWVVGKADDTVGVYTAAEVIMPGQLITASDVTVEQVNLARVSENYVLASQPWPDAVVAQHTISKGDLIPRGAFATTRSAELRPVAVGVIPAVAHGLAKGDQVELWYIPAQSRNMLQEEDLTPQLLAAPATVSDISTTGGGLIGGGQVTVHLLVPTQSVPEILSAQASNGELTVVAIPVDLS